MDLVKKATRQKVIDEVERFQLIKMINKAEEDTIRNKIHDKQFRQKLKKVKREYERIMKQQKVIDEVKNVIKKAKRDTKLQIKQIMEEAKRQKQDKRQIS